ncbi:MAG: DUF1501 domain-containing protein [Planctomyces sp.]
MTIDHGSLLDMAAGRRTFLRNSATGMGSLALGSLMAPAAFADSDPKAAGKESLLSHYAPRAKRIIYLFMTGAPSQLDLYDPKPRLIEMTGKDLPELSLIHI